MATVTPAGTHLMKFHVDEGPRAGESFDVGFHRVVAGSETDCEFCVSDPEASGEHVSFKMLDGHIEVHDLGSRSGTFVNGERITGTSLIGPGDHVRFGTTVLTALQAEAPPAPAPVFAGPAGPAATETGTPPTTAEHAPGAPPPPRPPGARRLSRGWLGGIGVLVAVAVAAGILLATGVFSGGTKQLTATQITTLDKPSTVLVISRGESGSLIAQLTGRDLLGGGSGWVYDASRGLIVTNAHVVVGGTTVQVGYDQTSLTDATIVGVDLADDIAVLKVAPALLRGLRTLPAAKPTSVHQGDAAYALGYPGNSTTQTNFLKTPFQVTNGLISALSTRVAVNTDELGFTTNDNSDLLLSGLYQTTAAINPGNSGGPLVNSRGQLIGMNVAKSGSAESQGYTIPISKLNAVVPRLASGQSIAWPGFGASAIPSNYASGWGLNGGLIITSVAKDTPAAQAGLTHRVSNWASGSSPWLTVVVDINNQLVTTEQQYVDALRQLQSGETMKLTVAAVDPAKGLVYHAQSGNPWVDVLRIQMP